MFCWIINYFIIGVIMVFSKFWMECSEIECIEVWCKFLVSVVFSVLDISVILIFILKSIMWIYKFISDVLVDMFI